MLTISRQGRMRSTPLFPDVPINPGVSPHVDEVLVGAPAVEKVSALELQGAVEEHHLFTIHLQIVVVALVVLHGLLQNLQPVQPWVIPPAMQGDQGPVAVKRRFASELPLSAALQLPLGCAESPLSRSWQHGRPCRVLGVGALLKGLRLGLYLRKLPNN